MERRIHFYEVDVGSDTKGRPLPFDFAAAIGTIRALQFSEERLGRYEDEGDGNVLCAFPDETDQNDTLRFCRIRRNGLPQLEQQGEVRNLAIDGDAGLVETTHVVFFPNNIIGADYNHYGPRPSRLGRYLATKGGAFTTNITFRHLVREDAASQLNRLGEIRLIDLSMRTSYRRIVEMVDSSIADAFEASHRAFGEPETVQIVVKFPAHSRAAILEKFMGPLRKLAGLEDLQENAKRVHVRGKCDDTGRVETIDLLKEQFISTKKIMLLDRRSRVLDPSSAYSRIREAYKEQEWELQRALRFAP